MKKLLAMLLVAVMSLSLGACGDGSQQEENKKDINIKDVDVVGTWKNIANTQHGMTMVLEEEGTGTVTLGKQVLDLTWERIDDDTLTITADSEELVFEMGVSDGVVELLWKGVFSHYTMVSEQDYNNMIEIVEITADNWQQYFEIGYEVDPRKNDFDEIIDLMIEPALIMKAEYADKFAGADAAVEAKISGGSTCAIEYNVTTGEVTFGESLTEDEANQLGLYYEEYWEDITGSAKISVITGFGGGRGCSEDNFEVNGEIIKTYGSHYKTVEVTRIQGTLYFKK